ncbi:hemolysin family protein [Lentisphaerota bacterium WC36G]|nr:hemolysin family protein [Lentisphaerae bacterium WC36]
MELKFEIEMLAVSIIVFYWLIAAWRSLTNLTGGRVRRVELTNRSLAKNLEEWLDNFDDYDDVFRLLSLLNVLVMAFFLKNIVSIKLDSVDLGYYEQFFVMLGIILVIIIGAELFSRIILVSLNVYLLKITLPIIKLLRYSIFYIAIESLNLLTRALQSSAKLHDIHEEVTAEDEILSLLDIEERADDDNVMTAVEEDEKRMIKGVFDLDNTMVREIMTPRINLTAIDIESTFEEVIDIIMRSGHSRIPVFKENIDNICGIAYAKDFLLIDQHSYDLEGMLHKVIFIPESKNIGDLFEELRHNSIHLAVVIDEYGGTAGVVTLEDIIEEIVGEIRDEYDVDEMPEPEPQFLDDGAAVIEGRFLISEFNEALDADIPEDEDVDTIGGYLCHLFGKIPEKGEEIIINGKHKFIVLEADKRKIISLKYLKDNF